jgi:hypothetical protein
MRIPTPIFCRLQMNEVWRCSPETPSATPMSCSVVATGGGMVVALRCLDVTQEAASKDARNSVWDCSPKPRRPDARPYESIEVSSAAETWLLTQHLEA